MRRVHLPHTLFGLLSLLLAAGCQDLTHDDALMAPRGPAIPEPITPPIGVLVTEIPIEVAAILEWHDVTARFVELLEDASVAADAREAVLRASVSVAVHDVVNAISPRYQHYAYAPLGRVTAPIAADIAIATATYAVLQQTSEQYGYESSAAVQAAQSFLRWRYVSVLQSVEAGAAKDSGVALGLRVARAVRDARVTKGGSNVSSLPASGARPGTYRPTLDDSGRMLLAGREWAVAPTFVLAAAGEIRPPAPYGGSDTEQAVQTPEYRHDFDEVKRIGSVASKRTREQASLLQFWEDRTPAVWNRIARALVVSDSLTAWDAARAFALMNLAQADAYIVSFNAIFTYMFWRPATAVRFADTDGNDDTEAAADWTPASTRSARPTPPYPEYVSGRAAASGAARAVLQRLLPGLGTFSVPAAEAGAHARTFSSLRHAADEVAESEVLRGDHFRTSTEVGLRVGMEIGAVVLDRAFAPRSR